MKSIKETGDIICNDENTDTIPGMFEVTITEHMLDRIVKLQKVVIANECYSLQEFNYCTVWHNYASDDDGEEIPGSVIRTDTDCLEVNTKEFRWYCCIKNTTIELATKWFDIEEMEKRFAELQVQKLSKFYGWLISQDFISSGSRSQPANGTCGPRGLKSTDVALLMQAAADLVMDKPSNLKNPTRFRLYDDDENLYFEGVIAGDYEGFEPLDDFGMPGYGCTEIRLWNAKTKEWETL